jgi:hypothetical protein
LKKVDHRIILRIYNGSSSLQNNNSQEAQDQGHQRRDNLIFQKIGWVIDDFDQVCVAEQAEMLLIEPTEVHGVHLNPWRTSGFYTEHLSALIVL